MEIRDEFLPTAVFSEFYTKLEQNRNYLRKKLKWIRGKKTDFLNFSIIPNWI